MKVSLQWLRSYLPELTDAQAAELGEVFPRLGLEVEETTTAGMSPNDKVVVGEVLSREPHPNADKLGVCQVNAGQEGDPLQIVCGASNYKVGDRVPVALIGATLPGDFKIKKSKLRGVESQGMMCSAKELGLGDDHAGLLILEGHPALGVAVHQLFAEPDTVFELELTANRGDCLSHLGVAREVAAWFRQSVAEPTVALPEPTPGPSLASVQVNTPNCPYYTALSLRGVKVAESPSWLKRALESIGLRPINNVVDVTNYVLWETGQPLHAFDAQKITGGQLIVRETVGAENITTLDEKPRCLPEGTMVITDPSKPLVIAGVMGSVDAEVDCSTTEVLLESAWFQPGKVRETTRALSLFSDSSHRFTRDVDPGGVVRWGQRAAQLILEVAGGELVGPMQVHGAPPRGERSISVTPAYVSRICGFRVDAPDLCDAYERLGFQVNGGDVNNPTIPLEVRVGSFRAEVDRPIDLVEEFIRLHGSDNLPEHRLRVPSLHRPDAPLTRFNQRAQDYLTKLGAFECCHYTLVPRNDVELVADAAMADALTLANPLTTEMDCLRVSLLPGLLGALQRNQAHGHLQARMAETGRVFTLRDGLLWERAAVALVLAETHERHWQTPPAPDFFAAKAIAETLLGQLEIGAVPDWQTGEIGPLWQPDHAAWSSSDSAWRLVTGLLKVDLVKAYDLPGLVWAIELTFDPAILAKTQPPVRFQPFGNHPATRRDMALLVPWAQSAETVRREIARAAQNAAEGRFNVEDVELFDLYEDERLTAEGKKSLAYTLTFRAHDRTLTEKEVNQAFDRIQRDVAEAGYALRS